MGLGGLRVYGRFKGLRNQGLKSLEPSGFRVSAPGVERGFGPADISHAKPQKLPKTPDIQTTPNPKSPEF